MKTIRLYFSLLVIIFFLSVINARADTGKGCLQQMKFVVFTIDCKWSDQELKSSKDYQLALLCEEFIQKNYSKIKYPVFLKPCFENTADPCYQITYDTYNFGGALNSDDDSYQEMLKEKSKFSRIGVNIRFHMKDSPEKILKLLEYSIKEEPRLKKRQKKLRKIIETNGSITSQEEDTLVIDEEQLLKILSQPPSPKIINFLKKYKTENSENK